MSFDRAAFFALAAALSATALACSANGDASDDTADELNQDPATCTSPKPAANAYPSQESCYDLGETWSQCGAWVNHFEPGVANKAIALKKEGKDAYDAGDQALRSACAGSDDAEHRLAKLCGQIAQIQLQSPGYQLRHGGTVSRDALVKECVSLVRGIRVESRSLIRRCVTRDPSYGVFSCVEGLGFDDVAAKCTDFDAPGSRTAFECSEIGGATCEKIGERFLPGAAAEIRACLTEYSIIKSEEGGARPTAEELTAETKLCAVGSVARSCQKDDAKSLCATFVNQLKDLDPALGTKGHINAGGAFTKSCNTALSAMTGLGHDQVDACFTRQITTATATGASGDAMNAALKANVSIQRCVEKVAANERT